METAKQKSARMRHIRAAGPDAVDRMNNEELRSAFLVDGLFKRGELHLVQSEIDRLILGGVVPEKAIRFPSPSGFGGGEFFEHREAGIINLGSRGIVRVDDACYELDKLDCLYVGRGTAELLFEPIGDSAPEFYFVSCPAHTTLPIVKISRNDAITLSLGDAFHASRRRICQYIHPQGARSCQLLMGLTELEEASVWNTMPAHIHERRSEIYLYTDLADEAFVVHLMGTPERTQHLIVRDREAVLSPSWSIHAGAGTRNYRFIWAMAGENQDFGDIDPLPLSALR